MVEDIPKFQTPQTKSSIEHKSHCKDILGIIKPFFLVNNETLPLTWSQTSARGQVYKQAFQRMVVSDTMGLIFKVHS